MNARRYASTRPTPALTGGDDRPRAKCADNWHPFDVLIDLTAGPGYQAALREARGMCGSCPLMATCLRANREEPWAAAVLGRKLPAVKRGACGRAAGVVQHSKNGEETCDPCRAFMRRKWARRHAPSKEIRHGTDTGYSRHRKAGEDACEPCKEAHRQMQRLRAARKKAAA